MDKECRHCKWVIDTGYDYICKRFPPIPVAIGLGDGQFDVQSRFPKVMSYDYCGEFQDGE